MIFNSNLAIYTLNPADFKNDKRHTQNLFLLPIEQIGKTEVTQIKSELLNFYDMGGFCQVRQAHQTKPGYPGFRDFALHCSATDKPAPPILATGKACACKSTCLNALALYIFCYWITIFCFFYYFFQ